MDAQTYNEYTHLTGRKRATVVVQLDRMVSKNLITRHDGGMLLSCYHEPMKRLLESAEGR